MKKIIFLFALLASMTASAAVTVTPLSVDYATRKITFRVSWTGSAANNRVWVWVDLCPMSGTSPGTFEKAVLSSPSVTAGSIAEFNQRGFYVNANPTTVTATLDNATGKFNWCVYGSDFPPNARDNPSGGYDLKGSPPFIINGTIEWSAPTYSGSEITALTDATGCPGVWCGKDGEAAGVLNCCANGTTKCSGTCKKIRTYETYDGACTGACNTAYEQLRNQCDEIINSQYGTYTENNCTTGCEPTNDVNCSNTGQLIEGCQRNKNGEQDCVAWCKSKCNKFKYYASQYEYHDEHQANYCCCWCCN